MSLNLVTLLYLVASVCFIQALKGLSHPTSSIRGNLFGMVGMGIAAVTTGALIVKLAEGHLAGMGWVLIGLLAGGAYGAWRAKTVEMTKMPELVAFFHSMIGLAAVFIAIAAVAEPHAFSIVAKGDPIPGGNRLELALGAAIGAITFSGSVIAFGKLSGTYKFRLFKGAPVQFPGQHIVNLVLGLALLFFIYGFVDSQSWIDFILLLAIAFVLGVTIIIPIGGALGHHQQVLGTRWDTPLAGYGERPSVRVGPCRGHDRGPLRGPWRPGAAARSLGRAQVAQVVGDIGHRAEVDLAFHADHLQLRALGQRRGHVGAHDERPIVLGAVKVCGTRTGWTLANNSPRLSVISKKNFRPVSVALIVIGEAPWSTMCS
jgi:hypothetical protein